MAFPIKGPWRIDTPNQRLAVALIASLIVHALLYGAWKVSPAASRFARLAMQRVFPRISQPLQPVKSTDRAFPRDIPTVFVEVDPAAAAAEPPKDSKFYSSLNAIAANKEANKDTEMPKLDGTQTKVVRTMDTPKPKAQPLQPTEPKTEPPPKEPEPNAEAPKPQPKPPEIGDLAMAKVEPRPKETTTETGTAPGRSRPRTLKEVVQRNPALAGQKSLQDGGVQRRARIESFNTRASIFGDYDYRFIRAVEQRWFQLLDENNQYLSDRQGKVTLTFRLHYDGRITDMAMDSNTVGDILGLLCQKAIIDPSPFDKWPIELRRANNGDYRDVRFTFYYD